MSDVPLNTFTRGLLVAMSNTGWKAAPLSVAASLSPSAVRDLLRKGGSPRLATAQALARVLGMTVQQIEALGAGGEAPAAWSPARPAGDSVMALADQARPFLPRTRLDAETLAAILAPGSRHVTLWRAAVPAAWLGILTGDVLLIEMKRPAITGETVLANVEDPASGEATTRLARLAGDILTSGEPGDPGTPLARARVQGPVVAVVRSPAFTAD